MCSDSDLKDLGLPMGPRKKLQGILKEELGKKVNYVQNTLVKHLVYMECLLK